MWWRPRRPWIQAGLSLTALALLPGLATAPASRPTLTVLHTSDLHGRVHPRDALADRDLGQGLARAAAAVKAVRAEGQPTLLLDSGDTIEGEPTQALVFEGAVGNGEDPMVRAMNLLGYDAMAVGNHDFDFGRRRLEQSRRQARFPWLAANVMEASGRPAFPAYVVRTVAGVRIGILGLVTRSVPSWEPPGRLAGLRFLDSVETAARYLPILRQPERCDVVVVLTHQGFDRDLDSGAPRSDAEENQAYALAQIPGVDLLLTGHTHLDIEPQRIGPTWVSQPGAHGRTLTRFDLWLEKAEGRWRLAQATGKNLPMAQVVPDPDVVRAVEPEHTAALARLAAPVATLKAPVSADGARSRDSPLLDWLHAVQQREGRAELSVASLLPERLADWPAGPLSLRQVWSLYPYENTLVTVRATGKQVRAALESAARCISGVGVVEQEQQPVWWRNPAVAGYNCDTLAGAAYALDPTRPEGQRLVFLKRNGQPVADEEVLTVALNSYRAAGGGYPAWSACPRVAESDRTVRALLVEDAQRQGSLRLEADDNWFLVPTLPEGRPPR